MLIRYMTQVAWVAWLRFALLGGLLLTPLLYAQPMDFYHKDWEMTCDNTRTCRAAGYGSEYEGQVSVLLTRAAGASTPITASVRFMTDDVSAPLRPETLILTIDGVALGALAPHPKNISDQSVAASDDLNQADDSFALPADQLHHLIQAVTDRDDHKIEWRLQLEQGAEPITVVGYQLSTQGARAVFLKMDDYQKRVGTVGALVAVGKKNERGVLPPLPPPILKAPAIPETSEQEAERLNRAYAPIALALIEQFQRKLSEEDKVCHRLDEYSLEDKKNSLMMSWLHRPNLVLVRHSCWLAAYNAGDAFWVLDVKQARIQLASTMGTDYQAGVISSQHKGRGIGDCWGLTEKTWDGKRFVTTRAMTTGGCRGFLGGTWDLPSVVYHVRP